MKIHSQIHQYYTMALSFKQTCHVNIPDNRYIKLHWDTCSDNRLRLKVDRGLAPPVFVVASESTQKKSTFCVKNKRPSRLGRGKHAPLLWITHVKRCELQMNWVKHSVWSKQGYFKKIIHIPGVLFSDKWGKT